MIKTKRKGRGSGGGDKGRCQIMGQFPDCMKIKIPHIGDTESLNASAAGPLVPNHHVSLVSFAESTFLVCQGDSLSAATE